MTLLARIEMIALTISAIVLTYTQGLKIDLSRLSLRRPNSYFVQNKRSDSGCTGNPCDASKPFLCSSSLTCVALKYVCDGTWDCDDGFDEDPLVCNAASRPDIDSLTYFLENQQSWIIPQLFNGASVEQVAHGLTVASDISDLSQELGMTPENEENLHTAFVAAMEGDERPLLKMGMSERSWHEVQYVLQKLLDSGFKI